jgi:hypothetical protein
MSKERDTWVENIRVEYREVCQSHRTITDFRAKLLTILPLASGAGIFLLLRKQSEPLEASHLAAIGIFGFVVTFGLFLHELRGIAHCDDLIKLGKALEDQLGVHGQFTREYSYYYPSGDFRIIRGILHEIVGPIGAAWIIYPSVCLAWLYVAAVGLGIPITSLLRVVPGVYLIGVSFWVAVRWWKPNNNREEGTTRIHKAEKQ